MNDFWIRIIPAIVWIIFVAIFSVYSYLGLGQLKQYGYVGDLCKITSQIYKTISISIVVITLILFLIV